MIWGKGVGAGGGGGGGGGDRPHQIERRKWVNAGSGLTNFRSAMSCRLGVLDHGVRR